MSMGKLDLAACARPPKPEEIRVTQAKFELAVERYIDAPPETVFKVWTERLEEWWAPKPWTTKVIEQDLRPGGRSAMVMSGPDGLHRRWKGSFLKSYPTKSIVVTNAFTAGWIPANAVHGWLLHLHAGRRGYTLSRRIAPLGRNDAQAA